MNKRIHGKFSEDKRIIGTSLYKSFQRMCSRAGFLAEKEARDRGLPITYVEGVQIVKEYADGRKEILGQIKPRVRARRVYKLR